jgi:hypothetical protein
MQIRVLRVVTSGFEQSDQGDFETIYMFDINVESIICSIYYF